MISERYRNEAHYYLEFVIYLQHCSGFDQTGLNFWEGSIFRIEKLPAVIGTKYLFTELLGSMNLHFTRHFKGFYFVMYYRSVKSDASLFPSHHFGNMALTNILCEGVTLKDDDCGENQNHEIMNLLTLSFTSNVSFIEIHNACCFRLSLYKIGDNVTVDVGLCCYRVVIFH